MADAWEVETATSCASSLAESWVDSCASGKRDSINLSRKDLVNEGHSRRAFLFEESQSMASEPNAADNHSPLVLGTLTGCADDNAPGDGRSFFGVDDHANWYDCASSADYSCCDCDVLPLHLDQCRRCGGVVLPHVSGSNNMEFFPFPISRNVW